MKTTLLIATYNWPEALESCLESVCNQKVLPDEVIVVDDGSSIETKRVIDQFKLRFKGNSCHVWIPDDGFRLSRIRNLGVLKAVGDQLIFIDGDCLLHPSFIVWHKRLFGKPFLIAGGRVLLQSRATQDILKKRNLPKYWHWKFVPLWLGALRRESASSWYKVKGCNFSVSRAKYIETEGFDESFVSWGREDSDFVLRFCRSGGILLNGRLPLSVLHLFHLEKGGLDVSLNEPRFARVLQNSDIRSPLKSVFLSDDGSV